MSGELSSFNSIHVVIQNPSFAFDHPSGQPGESKLWSKSKFTPEEDAKLLELCKNSGRWRNWNQIAADLGNRTARQCCNSYNNYLDPDLSNVDWIADEENLLLAKVKDYDTRWHRIACLFVFFLNIARKCQFEIGGLV
jgi:hypothetical protein